MAGSIVTFALVAAVAATVSPSAGPSPGPSAATVRADSTRADSALVFPPGSTPISARYLPPAGAGYVTEEVRVRTAERYSLAGTLVLPWRPVTTGVNRVRFPVVVMISDGGPHNRDHTPGDSLGADAAASYRPFAEIADTLARAGIASLRLDDRGVGSSTGTLANTDALDLTYDIRAALEYLRRRPEIDPARVVAIGLGEGALCAGMLGRFEADLTGLVLMSSPADPGRKLVEWRARRGGDAVSSLAAWAKRVESDRAARFLDTFDPLANARLVRCPVLLLEGGAGGDVPPGSATRLAEAMRSTGNADVTVRELPGLTHRLLPDPGVGEGPRLPREVLGEIAGWIKRQAARPRPAPAPPAAPPAGLGR